MNIVGIDPGVTGALARFAGGRITDVVDMPVFDGRADGAEIAAYLGIWAPDAVFLEWTQPMPKNGSIASYSLGLNSGIIIGVVQTLAIPLHRVRPAAWKLAMGLRGKPKVASRGLATELFPYFADTFRRVKDDGRAEAALIARHGAYQMIHQEKAETDGQGATVSDLWGKDHHPAGHVPGSVRRSTP